MSAPSLVATHYHAHPHRPTPVGRVCLDYDGRFLRRKVLQLDDGRSVLVDLPQTISLNDGDVLVLENGDEIAIVAAEEPLLEITTDDLTRIAWHVGNRHTPCQIESARLLIQPDHVIEKMLKLLGATTRNVVEPFTPEGGAYGHGRTHSHDHGDGHAHAH